MKAVQIVSGFGGGISSFVLNKAIEFRNKDIPFIVLTYNIPPKNFEQAILATGGQIIYLKNPKQEGFKQFYNSLKAIFSKIEENTLIHCHIDGYRALPFIVLANYYGLKRFTIHAHTNRGPFKTQKLKYKLDFLINKLSPINYGSCGIEASKSIFGEKVAYSGKVMHVPNSIDQDKYFNRLAQTEVESMRNELLYERSSDTIIVGHVGRFNQFKNHPFMLDIVENYKQQGLNVLLVLVGDGELYEDIYNEAKNRNLLDSMVFYGRSNEIDKLLEAFDVFILPSIREGLPTVAIEAQAKGKHCLLSDTITRECDLQLDLVKFLKTDSTDKWLTEISEISKRKPPEIGVIRDKIERLKFTNETSAELYEDFIKGNITNYYLETTDI